MNDLHLTTEFRKCDKHDCFLVIRNHVEFCFECAADELKLILDKLENKVTNEIRNS